MTAPKTKGHPTLLTLAGKLGLSRTTVSAILGGSQRYSEETVKRVFKEAELLNYRPNRSAQMVRRGRSNTIGIIHSGGPLQATNERARYLGRAIAATGYELLLADTQWHPSPTPEIVSHMIASRVEGLIFSAESALNIDTNKAIFKRLEEANIPVVLISHGAVENIPTVNSDFEDGFYQLTQHLIASGHRRLTLLLANHPDHTWHDIFRLRGFSRAICEAQGTVAAPIPANAYRPSRKSKALQGEVIHYSGKFDVLLQPFEPPKQAMEELFERKLTTDAILASNDDWAAAVISACLRRGLSVPEDIAVTGFDDTNLASHFPVPITSVSQPNEIACQRAVKLLLRQMRGLKEPAQNILLPCRLFVRESSASLPIHPL